MKDDGVLDNLGEIKRFAKERGGDLPWDFGSNPGGLSKKSRIIWEMLSIENKLLISKFNPFLGDRNLGLRRLNRRGLSQKILSEISGLGLSMIKRITAGARKEKG